MIKKYILNRNSEKEDANIVMEKQKDKTDSFLLDYEDHRLA